MPKTTIKVRVNQWDFFNRECKAASFRRDDFLNRALPGEIAMLRAIPPCDEEGARWLKRQWIEYGRQSDRETQAVPIQLAHTVLEQLNETCAFTRVPRDAFFDCALTYLKERLIDAVIVVKDPRTTKDLLSQVAHQINDEREEITQKNTNEFLIETIHEWHKSRNLDCLKPTYYKDRLHFDAVRVKEERMWREFANDL